MDTPPIDPTQTDADPTLPSAEPDTGMPLGKWILHNGWRAAKANRWAALLLWVFGAAVVGSYFYLPAAAHFWEKLEHIKKSNDPWFAMISTAIAGGLVPYLAQGLQTGVKRDWRPQTLIFVLLFWAEKGIEVDYLYKFQDWFWTRVLGPETTPLMIAGKVALDQLGYVPLLALPTMTLGYAWKKRNFSWKRLRADLSWRWYIRSTMPLYTMNMLVWVPTVSMIYTLPVALQLPVENMVLAFWSLVVLVLTHDADEGGHEEAPPAAAAAP